MTKVKNSNSDWQPKVSVKGFACSLPANASLIPDSNPDTLSLSRGSSIKTATSSDASQALLSLPASLSSSLPDLQPKHVSQSWAKSYKSPSLFPSAPIMHIKSPQLEYKYIPNYTPGNIYPIASIQTKKEVQQKINSDNRKHETRISYTPDSNSTSDGTGYGYVNWTANANGYRDSNDYKKPLRSNSLHTIDSLKTVQELYEEEFFDEQEDGIDQDDAQDGLFC